jgi:hypothetical protein
MAGTFYKYAERNVDTQINWAEVGKNVVDMLQEENRIREEKKAAIDEASREFGETLANAPTGDFQSANEWILGYAADASQARLIQDRLLRGGLLKVKDYTVMRQNLNDGTNQMFQVAKEYQDKAAETMSRYEGNISQETEAWLMEQVQGLSNFKNTKAYINPTNYSVSLAMMTKKVIDGKEVMVMETDPDKFMTINQLRNRMNVRLDKYNYVADVDRMVSSLGEYQTADIRKVAGVYKMVSVKEVLDPTMRDRLSDEEKKTITAYQEWEDNSIKSQLANPYNQLSLLTDAIDKVPETGEAYKPTFDAELAKTSSKYILLEDNGTGMPVPKFTEEQTKVATEFLRAQTRNALDRKTSVDVSSEPQPYPMQQWQYDAGREDEAATELVNLIGAVYYGNGAEIDASLEFFRDYIPNAKELVRNDNGVTVFFKDGTERFVSFTNDDGTEKDLETFIKGASALFAGDVDVITAVESGRINQGGELSLGLGEQRREVSGTTTTRVTPQRQAVNYLNNSLTADVLNQEQDIALPAINAIVQPLGFTATKKGRGNVITIVAPDKDEKTFSLNKGTTESQQILKEMLSWIQGHLSEDRVRQAYAAGLLDLELDN